MGENGRWVEFSGILPGAGPIMRALVSDRWLKAEARTSELIGCIQPNPLSEERRNAVADHVQRLIMNCFPCQVCTFGSVPLKTYLPDGDIDLTAFSHDPNLKDTWANQVRDMLENEEKNENAEFHVKEVQYIQAEVKIIKCLVENIVVDISFNQVGGLCTLCFLDEVDYLINQDHLFKRSIILIKAWCYYESRILGAHHGLISTYALETLVLYIFHVFNNSFRGPLEVLYRFLEFFSNFDWDNFCVSLWGPVPINTLPTVTPKPPRNDSEKLLLSKWFLDSCSSAYAVFPGGLENNGQPFVSKHFNVIDPLRVNNNLGRSVSKGNFYRIRSAFAFGAKRLTRLLDCPEENIIIEVNRFFTNTWKRHGSGHRPDATVVDSLRTGLSTPDDHHEYGNYNNNSSRINMKENDSAGIMPMTSGLHATSQKQSIKIQPYVNNRRATNQTGRVNTSNQVTLIDKFEKDVAADQLVSDSRGRFLARTRSSPELTDAYGDASSQSRRDRLTEIANAQATSGRLDNSDRSNNNLGSGSSVSHSRQSSAEDGSFMDHFLSQRGIDPAASDSNISSTSYHQNLGIDPTSDVSLSTAGAVVPHLDEQDIANMMAETSLHGFSSSDRGPLNLNSAHLPFQIPPSLLHAMAYPQRNMPGFAPINTTLINPSFPYGLVSPQLTHYPSIGVNSRTEDSYDRDTDNYSWQGQDASSSPSYDSENGNFNVSHSGDKPPPPVSGWKYVPPHRQSGLVNSARVQQKHSKDKRGSSRQNSYNFPVQDTRSSENFSEERSTSSKFSSATRSNSLRSRTSSESSWDGSSIKTSKSTKEKRGKKTASAELVNTSHGIGKTISNQLPNQADDDQKWVPRQSVKTEVIERDPGSDLVASLHVPVQNLPGYDAAQTSGSDSMVSFPPMFINPGSNSRQRGNDSSRIIAFYPTGPPIPFLTMLPVYNIPPDSGTSDASSSHFGGDESLENYESEDHSQPSSSLQAATANDGKKSDILNSDFDSHWQNLQLGRLCQNPRYPSPLLYPSPMMVPPTYLQGQVPYDNPVRPLSANSNVFSQLMTNYGHHLVPVTPLQSVSAGPSNVYQPYLDDMPRYRSGTGTYLPNPKITTRGRLSSGSRRGGYNHDRNDAYGDREGNWNSKNPKSRSGLRGHGRSQTARSNFRADHLPPNEVRSPRSWNAHVHESVSSYPSQNGQMRSNFSESGPQSIAYNMYPSASSESDGISNGPSVPPVMMLYPFDHNASTYGRHDEKLEFGSLGGIMSEQLHMNEGARSRTSEESRPPHVSSPDQPSSPHHYRRR